MDIKSRKQILRESVKERRNTLTATQVRESSRHIARRLQMIDWSKVSAIHTYLPLRNNSEIDPTFFIHWMWRTWPSVRIVTSFLDDQWPKTMAGINKNSEFIEDKHGILQPKSYSIINNQFFDCIIVPMLVGDRQGGRLGYGKGWYDTFLASVNPRMAIGLCYEQDIVDQLPVELHDYTLDIIVTEKRIIG